MEASKLESLLSKTEWRWIFCWDGKKYRNVEGLDCACCVVGKKIKGCLCVCHKRMKFIADSVLVLDNGKPLV